MNRIDRLTAIILLLQGGRRTAFRDIQALREIGVPIVTESGAHGGYTLMPDYSQVALWTCVRASAASSNAAISSKRSMGSL
jgi:predicted DNA-binding transcriptional regulator YafY